VKIRCTLQECGGVHIRILNSYGLLVREFLPDHLTTGDEIRLFIGDLAPGFYLVKLLEKKGTFLAKLLIE
jgi:hypothetical protein